MDHKPAEIVIISGKGGTGKTSLAASFAVLADRPVIADCDVDASDMHLLLSPRIGERHDFYSGNEAVIRRKDCIGCGACLAHCRFGAVKMEGNTAGDARFRIEPFYCEGCGVCVRFCPVQAVDFPEKLSGEWMISDTRCGPMVHARLGVSAGNSGKLVSTVRNEARRIAVDKRRPVIIVDGPPGIGCPVIASIAGADAVVAVAEPTLSGIHDLDRVSGLTRHFGLPLFVCVNKWDVNAGMTETIGAKCAESGAVFLGRISYDPCVTKAQIAATTVIEYGDSVSVPEIRTIWERLCQMTRQ